MDQLSITSFCYLYSHFGSGLLVNFFILLIDLNGYPFANFDEYDSSGSFI